MDIFEKEKLLEDDTKDFGSASYLRCILHTDAKVKFLSKKSILMKTCQNTNFNFRTSNSILILSFDPNWINRQKIDSCPSVYAPLFLCVTEEKKKTSDSAAEEWFSIRDHPFSLSILYCGEIYFK